MRGALSRACGLTVSSGIPESRSSMDKATLRAKVEEVGIVPVIRTSSGEDARFAVEEIARGGIPIIEVTMTVPGAIEVIRDLAKSVPGVILGAGTVVDVECARQCIGAGAQFISNPALDLPTVEFVARKSGVIMLSDRKSVV